MTTIERVRPLTSAPVMAVLTKADSHGNLLGDLAMASVAVSAVFAIPTAVGIPDGDSESNRAAGRSSGAFQPVIAVSAEDGTGLGALLGNIVRRLSSENSGSDGAGGVDEADTPITRERHRLALARSLEEVCDFERAWREDEVPAAVAAVHLRAAVHELEELVGSVNVDDVLDRLFREFCVGK